MVKESLKNIPIGPINYVLHRSIAHVEGYRLFWSSIRELWTHGGNLRGEDINAPPCSLYKRGLRRRKDLAPTFQQSRGGILEETRECFTWE